MPFNPLTAYSSDWRHLNANLIDSARFERRRGNTLLGYCNAKALKPDVTHPRYQVIIGALLGGTTDTVFVIWLLASATNPVDDLYSTETPGLDDKLIINHAQDNEETWRITNVSAPRVAGEYTVAAVKVPNNG